MIGWKLTTNKSVGPAHSGHVAVKDPWIESKHTKSQSFRMKGLTDLLSLFLGGVSVLFYFLFGVCVGGGHRGLVDRMVV